MTSAGYTENPDLKKIAQSGDPNGRLEHRRTPLIWAAWRNDVESARQLLARGAAVDAADAFGWTPLTCAGWNGCAESARLLLENGAEVDHRDEEGCTPLMRAAANNRADTVQLLLQFGAAVDIRSGAGKTAGDYAAKNHCAESLVLLAQAARGALPPLPPTPAVEKPVVIRWPKGFNL